MTNLDQKELESLTKSDLSNILIADALSLRHTVEDFKGYWERCEPQMSKGNAPKSELIKYLFAYLTPQIEVEDRQFYRSLSNLSKELREAKIPEKKKKELWKTFVVDKIEPKIKSIADPLARHQKFLFDVIGAQEILTPGNYREYQAVQGNDFVIKGPSPFSFKSLGVVLRNSTGKTNTAGNYLHDFFTQRGGDCYTYALGSCAMLKYFGLNVQFARIKVNDEKGGQHYFCVINLDGNQIIFDPLMSFNKTWPHKRKYYFPDNFLDVVVEQAKNNELYQVYRDAFSERTINSWIS